MATRFTDGSQTYTATNGPLGVNFTFVGWAYLAPASPGASSMLFSIDGGTSNSLDYLSIGVSNTTPPRIGVFSASHWIDTGDPFVNGTWYCLALSVGGNWCTFYWGTDPSALNSVSGDTYNGVRTHTFVGNNSYGQWWQGRIAAFKVWNGGLTKAQIQAELGSYTQIQTGAVREHHLQVPETIDYSGNDNNLTGGVGATTEPDPPIDPAVAHDVGGGAVATGTGLGAAAVEEPPDFDKGGGIAASTAASGTKTVAAAAVHDQSGGAIASGSGLGAAVVEEPPDFDVSGGVAASGAASGAKTVVGPVAHDQSGGAVATASGLGAAVVEVPPDFDVGGGVVASGTASGAKAVTTAVARHRAGGGVATASGLGAAVVEEPPDFDEGGGAVASGAASGMGARVAPEAHTKAGGAVATGSAAGAMTVGRVGGASVVGSGSGSAVVVSPVSHPEDGGGVVQAVGSGAKAVADLRGGGVACLGAGAGTAELVPPLLDVRAGGGTATATGSGSGVRVPPATHDKTGGVAVTTTGGGRVNEQLPTVVDKAGGAAGMRIAEGTKVLIRLHVDTGGPFVTLRRDFKVRVGDTWGSPTWAVLLPGGYGVDLADGWTMTASVKRNRCDGGEVVHVWAEPNGIWLGQAEVTLADGTVITTSTVALYHTGAESEEWPIFVGRWDFEIAKGDADYTIAAGSFRTIREVTHD